MKNGLVLALTGAAGTASARYLLLKSPWPVTLVASEWGKKVYERECGKFQELSDMATETWEDNDLTAPIASGSVPTKGMVVLPCTSNTLAEIAHGTGGSLITRAAHCHLKERRPLVLCVREAPLSLIDIRAMAAAAEAGAIIMPLSPPFYMQKENDPDKVTLAQLFDAFADRVLAQLGAEAGATWEDVR